MSECPAIIYLYTVLLYSCSENGIYGMLGVVLSG